MTRRSEPPFRADHVGSLLRPPDLLDARARHTAGSLDAAGLRAVEDAAIREVVGRQEEAGLPSVTDGEFRRTSWHMDFIYRLGGITKTDRQIRVTMRSAAGEGELDLSAADADELRALHGLGCRYLQLDDTALAYLNDPAHRARPAAEGDDPQTRHLRYIRQINAAIADRPADMAVTTHLCRGNYRFKSGVLEDADALKWRIDEAARYVPLEQLCLSPQCGFASTVEGNALTADEQWAKLALIVSVAEDVWG